jgi:Helix-turn-helix domain
MVPKGGRHATSNVQVFGEAALRAVLSLAEREEIALLWVQGHPMQEIGCRLGRSASTISRELRRSPGQSPSAAGASLFVALPQTWNSESNWSEESTTR